MARLMSLVRTIYNGFFKLEEWDVGGPFTHVVLRGTDSVAGLLVDMTNERFLLVRQQRPAMIREDNPDGFITEAVAGRFDVNLGPKALMVKETKEEAGVEISEKDVELLNHGLPMALSAGATTERSYLAYVEIHPDAVDPDDQQQRGVADEGEAITRVWHSFDDIHDMNFDCVRVLALVQHLKIRLLQTFINQGYRKPLGLGYPSKGHR